MSSTEPALGNQAITWLEVDGATQLTDKLISELGEFLDRAEDIGTGAVILVHVRGVPSLVDRNPWPGNTSIQAVTKWERTLRRMERSSATTVVMVEHNCFAHALELLMVADCRLISSTANVQLAAPGVVAWPSMGLHRLAHQIGFARSRKFTLSGRTLSALAALDLDIVDEIVKDLADGLKRIEQWLGVARQGDVPINRRLLLDGMVSGFDDAFGAHLAACDRLLRKRS